MNLLERREEQLMVAVTMTMTVLPAKRRELLLTLDELITVMRHTPGLLAARVEVQGGDADALTFVEEWDSQDAVNAYLASDHFRVLHGAMQLLTAHSHVMFVEDRKTCQGGEAS